MIPGGFEHVLHGHPHAIIGKADRFVLRFQGAVIVMAAVPVFLQMNKQNLFGLEARRQVKGLFKGIEGSSGDMFGRVPETMFQPLLKYPWLDDQQIGLLNLF